MAKKFQDEVRISLDSQFFFPMKSRIVLKNSVSAPLYPRTSLNRGLQMSYNLESVPITAYE